MAVTPNNFKSKPSPENIYAFLIVLFGVVLGYILYSHQLFSITEPVSMTVRPPDTENMAKLEAVKLDFSIFENIIFQELRVFGEIPVTPGTTGKDNPFSP